MRPASACDRSPSASSGLMTVTFDASARSSTVVFSSPTAPPPMTRIGRCRTSTKIGK